MAITATGKPVDRGSGPVVTGKGARMVMAMAGGRGRSIARGIPSIISRTATGKCPTVAMTTSTQVVTGIAPMVAVMWW
ncbi:hypothetical protein D3C71_1716970 [compost metagenome]